MKHSQYVKDCVWFHYCQRYDGLPDCDKAQFPKLAYGLPPNEYDKQLAAIAKFRVDRWETIV